MPFKETCVMGRADGLCAGGEGRSRGVFGVVPSVRDKPEGWNKWLDRYEAAGPAGLHDRSRAPLSHPQAITSEAAEACLAVRRSHPQWGPEKLRGFLARKRPERRWPAASTIGALFDREGLTVKRRRSRRAPAAGPVSPFSLVSGPDIVWCVDFKGWFLTGDGSRCEPMTLSDAISRYLLRCQAMVRNDGAPSGRCRRRGSVSPNFTAR
jgi:hypothetical protein